MALRLKDLLARVRRVLDRYIADDDWLGEDKYAHLGWSALLATLLLIAGTGAWTYWLAIAAVGVAVELVQLYRYLAWQRRGGRSRWPFFADEFSYKDVAWDLAGGVLAIPLLLLARWLA